MKNSIIFMLLLFLFSSGALAAICPAVDWDRRATVKLINDGDTITLEDGELVRLIGINTPEINHVHLERSEPYALQAKNLLERYIKAGDKVKLVFDKKRRDKYGRLLAYVYSKGGRNLAEKLLRAGLAEQWVIGKNDRFWQCLQRAGRRARLARKGIWSDFSPLRAQQLSSRDSGYQYIRGQITDIHKSKKGLVFFFDRKLRVWISSANLKKFNANNIKFLEHDRLLLNGKVRFSDNKLQMTLYHPVQILP